MKRCLSIQTAALAVSSFVYWALNGQNRVILSENKSKIMKVSNPLKVTLKQGYLLKACIFNSIILSQYHEVSGD